MLRFGARAIRSAVSLAKRFRGAGPRALLAGCAAHSFLPLDRALTGAIGLIFLVTGHAVDWPVAAGGSHDDWPTYDRVMTEQRRAAVFVAPQRVYSNG